MIEVEKLSKSYRGRKVVDSLSFAVSDGTVFALLGSNGAGKSTTIKMMLGLTLPDEGTVTLSQKTVGYSPETPYFPPFLTGREVLCYYGSLQKIPKRELATECGRLLDMVGLQDDKTRVGNYSKGMLQRLALAQALLGDPKLLIFDEPCAGLDAVGRIEMLKLLMQLKAQGKTILINSHILSDIERVCDAGIILKEGRAVRTFTGKELSGEMPLEKMFVEAVGGAGEKGGAALCGSL